MEALEKMMNMSVRKASRLSGTPITTLRHYQLKLISDETMPLVHNYQDNKVFTDVTRAAPSSLSIYSKK